MLIGEFEIKNLLELFYIKLYDLRFTLLENKNVLKPNWIDLKLHLCSQYSNSHSANVINQEIKTYKSNSNFQMSKLCLPI